MKPEELARYERMYRAMEKLMGTKLLRFSFPGQKGLGCPSEHPRSVNGSQDGCKGAVGPL